METEKQPSNAKPLDGATDEEIEERIEAALKAALDGNYRKEEFPGVSMLLCWMGIEESGWNIVEVKDAGDYYIVSIDERTTKITAPKEAVIFWAGLPEEFEDALEYGKEGLNE